MPKRDMMYVSLSTSIMVNVTSRWNRFILEQYNKSVIWLVILKDNRLTCKMPCMKVINLTFQSSINKFFVLEKS